MVLLVLLDEPELGLFGGVVAAPLFRTIARGTLRHLGVVPQGGAAKSLAGSPGAEFVRVPKKISRVPNIKRNLGFPDFTGLSLREAVSRARALNLQVEIHGHGYVVGQAPLPGARWRSGETLTMTLRGR